MSSLVIFDGTQAGTVTQNPPSTVTYSGGTLNVTTTASYQVAGYLTLTTNANISSFIANDRIDFTMQFDANPMYITLALNASSHTIFAYLSNDMPLNTPITLSYIIPPAMRSSLTSSISRIELRPYNPCSAKLINVTIVQTDLGSLASSVAGAPATINGQPSVPATSIIRTDLSGCPTAPNNSAWLAFLGGATLHRDFGTFSETYGMPINYGTTSQLASNMVSGWTFGYVDDIQFTGPYPYNSAYNIELPHTNGQDMHMIVFDTQLGKSYETFQCCPTSSFQSVANFDATAAGVTYSTNVSLPYATWAGVLNTNALTMKTTGLTSATASGMALMPTLVKYNEVTAALAAGASDLGHALRMTVPAPGGGAATVSPSTHSTNGYPQVMSHLYSDAWHGGSPPLGSFWLLNSAFDISSFSSINKLILNTLKKYGAIVDDWGGAFYISGVIDNGWTLDLDALAAVHITDGRFIDHRSKLVNATSMQAASSSATLTGIAVIPTTKTIAPSSTWQMIANANYSDSSTANITSTATWTSSNTANFTVNSAGLVSCTAGATSGSTANITASFGGFSAVCVFTATSVTTALTLDIDTLVIPIYATHQLVATAIISGTPTIVSGTAFTSNSANATVNSSGLVTMVSGPATITCSYGGFTAVVNVWPQAVGTFTSHPLYSDPAHPATSILRNTTLIYVTLIDDNNHVCIGNFGNITTDANGIFTVSSPLITPGQNLRPDWRDVLGGYRLPSAVSAA